MADHACPPLPRHVPVDYAFDRKGGFAVRIPGTVVHAYAYPSSDRAAQARRNPIAAAHGMLEGEMCGLGLAVEYWGYQRARRDADAFARRFGWKSHT